MRSPKLELLEVQKRVKGADIQWGLFPPPSTYQIGAGGRHLKFGRETPLTNLYVRLLDEVGVQVKSFGDSTGKLDI